MSSRITALHSRRSGPVGLRMNHYLFFVFLLLLQLRVFWPDALTRAPLGSRASTNGAFRDSETVSSVWKSVTVLMRCHLTQRWVNTLGHTSSFSICRKSSCIVGDRGAELEHGRKKTISFVSGASISFRFSFTRLLPPFYAMLCYAMLHRGSALVQLAVCPQTEDLAAAVG